MTTQTRKEHHEDCARRKEAGERVDIPELINGQTRVGTYPDGQPQYAKEVDWNEDDYREIDDKGNPGPWQKANAESRRV
jgi:hypothetical protein